MRRTILPLIFLISGCAGTPVLILQEPVIRVLPQSQPSAIAQSEAVAVAYERYTQATGTESKDTKKVFDLACATYKQALMSAKRLPIVLRGTLSSGIITSLESDKHRLSRRTESEPTGPDHLAICCIEAPKDDKTTSLLDVILLPPASYQVFVPTDLKAGTYDLEIHFQYANSLGGRPRPSQSTVSFVLR